MLPARKEASVFRLLWLRTCQVAISVCTEGETERKLVRWLFLKNGYLLECGHSRDLAIISIAVPFRAYFEKRPKLVWQASETSKMIAKSAGC